MNVRKELLTKLLNYEVRGMYLYAGYLSPASVSKDDWKVSDEKQNNINEVLMTHTTTLVLFVLQQSNLSNCDSKRDENVVDLANTRN